jgi:hypothetical protein
MTSVDLTSYVKVFHINASCNTIADCLQDWINISFDGASYAARGRIASKVVLYIWKKPLVNLKQVNNS